MTPEGRIKARIDVMLKARDDTWWFKPVQHGMGTRALDYVGCTSGYFWAVEAKAPGKEPDNYQRITIKQMLEAGAKVFKISSDDGLTAFNRWINGVNDGH